MATMCKVCRLAALMVLVSAFADDSAAAQEPKKVLPKFAPAAFSKRADANGDSKLNKYEFVKLTSAFPKAKADPEMPANTLAIRSRRTRPARLTPC